MLAVHDLPEAARACPQRRRAPGTSEHLGPAGALAGRAPQPGCAAAWHAPPAVPTDAENAAAMALRATHADGNALSQNQIMERFGLTRAAATKVRTANGHREE